MKTDFDLDKLVTEAMDKEPMFTLPIDFADSVAKKGVRKYKLRKDLNEYYFYAAVVSGLGLFIAGFLFFVSKDSFQQITNFVTGNLVPIISVVFLANFVLFADKVLLRQLFILKK